MIWHPTDCQYDLGIGPTLSRLEISSTTSATDNGGAVIFYQKKNRRRRRYLQRSKVLCNYLLYSKTLVCTRSCWRSNWCTLISMIINNYILAIYLSIVSSECHDDTLQCHLWAHHGHCRGTAYAEFMRRHCKATCGYCGNSKSII